MNLLRERYRVDLVELQAACEANYARLLRLLPDMRHAPEARRKAVPGVRLCVNCQSGRDRAWHPSAGINRRGSKDSQLR